MQVKALRLREGEDRAAPVSRGNCVFVGKKRFVEIGRREDRGNRPALVHPARTVVFSRTNPI